jgi:hypothetical protein
MVEMSCQLTLAVVVVGLSPCACTVRVDRKEVVI